MASANAVFGWAPGGRTDRVDLIHGFGAERIEFGLNQIPHRAAVGRNEYLGGLLEFLEVQELGRDVEPGHRRLCRIMFQRQQERRRLAEPGAQLFDLVDELSHRVGDLAAPAGEPVGAVLQLVQVPLQPAGLVHPHGAQHVGELRQRRTQAVRRRLQCPFVRVVLQLVGQVVDRVEVP